MKVAVVTNQAPFVRGGAELITEWLSKELSRRGHDAEIIRLPFQWDPPQRVLEHMLAARLMRLGTVDRVIPMKFPAYCIKHHSKVVWLMHQFRQAYDLWATPYGSLPDTTEGSRIRDAVARVDNAYLIEAEKIYTNSATTRNRLASFNGLKGEVLYPPIYEPELYRSDGYGDFLFSPSRISPGKRQELLVRALAETRSDVRLVLAGSPDAPEHLHSLRRLIEELDVGDRVELHARWISEEHKRDLFAGALACAYVPYDEDYGYVTLEAFHSGKAVVACDDSGGTLELIEDRKNGFVTAPDPESLAAAMDELRDDAQLAERMGQAARARIDELDISWDRVIDKLLA